MLLDAIEREPRIVDENLCKLVIGHIINNSDRVKALINLSNSFSDALLGSDPSRTSGLLDSLDDIDRQCLFIMKLQGGLKLSKHDEFVDYLRNKENSSWVRGRFLYPLVYYSLNAPNDGYIDTFLSFMMPQDDTGGVERSAVRHLLRDDLSFERSLGYRAYLGLGCHPFDALESITNYIELEFVRDDKLSDHSKVLASRLSEAFPSSRLKELLTYINRRHASLDGNESAEAYGQGRLPPEVAKTIAAFVDSEARAPDPDSLPNDEWRALCRMRWSRYPDEPDFDHITGATRSYNFLEFGRVFAALNTSMYMVPRQSALSEKRDLIRLHRIAGTTTPYIWASPRGQTLMREQMRSDPVSWLGADLKAGAIIGRSKKAADRSWLHAVHWELQRIQRSGHVRRWLEEIRSSFEVRPQYLTGIDWTWIDEVLPASRVTPFRDNTNGPYALLLRDIEERQRDSTLLRTAIEPQKRGLSCAEFVQCLFNEYGKYSVAFVRYFLTAENIMLLGLAPNMTAALSERISALEKCASSFDFGELLPEGQLRIEQKTLTSALMLLNVNANQFDIPWATFSSDAADRQNDNYNAYSAFKRSDKTLQFTSDQRTLYAHRFANGRIINYSLLTSQATLAVLIIGVIDAFYDHPSYGIEAILSTRFRHDTLRREYVTEFAKLETMVVPGVMRQEQIPVVKSLSSLALDVIDDWLVRRMQTLRPGHDEALFDFTPDPEELSGLMKDADLSDSIDQVVEVVVNWIIARLDSCLEEARDSFANELTEKMVKAIHGSCATIAQQHDCAQPNMSRLVSAVTDTAVRSSEALIEWFKRPDDRSQKSLTFGQVKSAVEGRFERQVASRQLHIALANGPLAQTELVPEKVKLYFDLLSEIVNNALKYDGRERTRMRITPYHDGEVWGFIYSSLCSGVEIWNRTIKGDPYQSLSDALFRDSNSGLDKIAAISASITGAPATILAERRRGAFHLRVPIGLVVVSQANDNT